MDALDPKGRKCTAEEDKKAVRACRVMLVYVDLEEDKIMYLDGVQLLTGSDSDPERTIAMLENNKRSLHCAHRICALQEAY